MSSQQWPAQDPDQDSEVHLTLRVCRRPGHSSWAWELVDTRDARVFEAGLPYESEMKARRAGLARLVELTPSLAVAKADAPVRPALARRYLIIVSQNDETLYRLLTRAFDNSEGIEVIQDRRRLLSAPDRIVKDRRATQTDVEAQGKTWWMVRRSAARRPTNLEESP
jgi:hypothetical protein